MAKRHVVPARDGVKIQGFLRVMIMDYDKDGLPTIVARDEKGRAKDSGYIGPNQVTNIGFMNYINYYLGVSTGSQRISYAAIATGTGPASDAGSLPGEYSPQTNSQARKSVLFAAANSTLVRFTCSWASDQNTTGANYNVQSAGLYAHSSELSLMCGKSFTSSTWGTNQALNLTYELNLS